MDELTFTLSIIIPLLLQIMKNVGGEAVFLGSLFRRLKASLVPIEVFHLEGEQQCNSNFSAGSLKARIALGKAVLIAACFPAFCIVIITNFHRSVNLRPAWGL